ncbi:hypothetical protein [uncultured Tateyamaria sp.]|uniref:hypothetical protein n=1 Tax=uncultured Tateyamaria sp. TaxID=455651 RepID=UPI00261F4BF2|nr:hypothetical protein [uncultured Tateyamaria sp.]
MSSTRKTIRNIDDDLYRQARVMAVENDMPTGELISHCLAFFINEGEFLDVDQADLSYGV